MRIFNKQIVDAGHLQGLEAANKQLKDQVNNLGKSGNRLFKEANELALERNYLLEKVDQLERVIADNKFLPSTKPNLELAAKTVAAWGNNRTIASFFKKLVFLVDDSMIETIHRYTLTEIKKRKLELVK